MPIINKIGKQKVRTVTSHDNFYSGRPWRRLRLLKLKLNPLCEVSLRKGIAIEATVVDHKFPRRFWPELEYDLDNMISMTTTVHNRKRNIESRIHSKADFINIFGAQGEGVLDV